MPLNLDFTKTVDMLVEKTAEFVLPIRQALSSIYPASNLSGYWNPELQKVALYLEPYCELDKQWALEVLHEKLAAEHIQTEPLALEDLANGWVKVAHSPTLRAMGEAAHFFPSNYSPVGGKPVAALVASGLLGAGLGYGTGWLGEQLIPNQYQEKGKLRKNMALAGAGLGLGVGAIPGLVNWHDGRKFNDDTLWNKPLADSFEADTVSPTFAGAVKSLFKKTAAQVQPYADTLGGPSFDELPLIKLDSFGNVLWGTKSNPTTTAMTLGTIYGASQMPDPNAQPNTITPHQTGLFGMAMGAAGGGLKGYIAGRAVGIGLGLLTGLPEKEQNMLGRSGAMLGVVNSLVPTLFRG